MDFKDYFSRIAKNRLNKEKFLALRRSYFAAKAKLSPVIKLIYGTFDAADLRHHLEQRLGGDFEILMVHSSVNHMQPAYTQGPLELMKMLIEFCGTDKTLVMPAFCFGGHATGKAVEDFLGKSHFDIRRTPSQMGLVTELFRRTKGVVQSRHPIYRMSALGPLADALVRGHEAAGTLCGEGTPFDFMAKHRTKIIGIGTAIEVLTHVHHAEDIMAEAFPVPSSGGYTTRSVTLVDGNHEIKMELRSRGLAWPRNMNKLRNIMDSHALQEWRFHNVPLFATQAKDVTEAIIGAARLGVTLYERP